LAILDINLPELDGLSVTREIRREPKISSTPIILLTARGLTHEKVKGFEAGADDYVTKPFEPEELLARAQALISRTVGRVAPEPPARGQILVFLGAKGGAGTSFVVSNCAIALTNLWSSGSQEVAVIVDLQPGFGHQSTLFDIRPKYNLMHFIVENALLLDDATLNSYLPEVRPGCRLLAGVTGPAEFERVRAEAVSAVLERLSKRFAFVLVDLPHRFTEIELNAMDAASHIIVLLTPDITSFKSAATIANVFNALRIPPERWSFVFNQTCPRDGLTAAAAQETLKRPMLVSIPYASERGIFAGAGNRALKSINVGQPLVALDANHPTSLAIEDLALHLSRAAALTGVVRGKERRLGRARQRLRLVG